MSWIPNADPENADPLEMVIVPRSSDIGGFEVLRALPFRKKRMVGPFIFWDQMGPGEFLSGQGIDVRPHPHIGLSTVTYLFDGTLDHKDSLGNDVRVQAGDINLMTAGAGIVHSERTGADVRQAPSRIFGIQSWMAQPRSHEDGSPSFSHTAVTELPSFSDDGLTVRLILGEFGGLRSPVETQWPTLYLDLVMQSGSTIQIPGTTEERAAYALSGDIEIGGVAYPPRQMLVLRPSREVAITARSDVRLMVLGGAVMDGPRFISWNFVSSSQDRLIRAREDWKQQRFPKVPGDESEFVPLPE